MTEQSVDEEYASRLKNAFSEKDSKGRFTGEFPKDFDIWVNIELERAFYPLCLQLATDVRSWTPQEILEKRDSLPGKPETVPLIRPPESDNVLNYDSSGIAAFIAFYREGDSKEGVISRAVENKDNLGLSLDTIMVPSDASLYEDSTLPFGMSIIKEKVANGVFQLEESYDEIAEVVIPQLPVEMSEGERRRLVSATFISSIASGIPKDFELSARGEKIAVIAPLGMEEKLGVHFLWLNYVAPDWFPEDPTVTQDLLVTLNILSEFSTDLSSYAEELIQGRSNFVNMETSRGREAEGVDNVMLTLNEGLISIMQSINMAAGQLRHETDLKGSALIYKIMKDEIPNKIARYLPTGFLGPVHLAGRFIKSLIELKGDKLDMNQRIKNESKKNKKRMAKSRSGDITLTEYNLYDKRHTRTNTLSLKSGQVCPVSRNGSKISGVELLTYAFLSIYSTLRQERENNPQHET